jgi:hypothetical protein
MQTSPLQDTCPVNETSPNRLPEAGRLVAGLFLLLLVTVPGWS